MKQHFVTAWNRLASFYDWLLSRGQPLDDSKLSKEWKEEQW